MTETPPVREASTTRVPAARRASAEPPRASLPGHLARVALGAAAATAAVLGGVVGAGLVPLAAPGGASLAFGAVPELPPVGATATEVVDDGPREPVADLGDATAPTGPRTTSERQQPAPTRRAVPSTPPRVPAALPSRPPVAPPPVAPRPAPGTPVATPDRTTPDRPTPDRPTPTTPDDPGAPSSTPGTPGSPSGAPPTSNDPPRGGGQGSGRGGGRNDGRTGDGRSGADRPTGGAGAAPSSAAPRA